MLERLRERFFDIRPEEWPRALGLALFFFLVIAVFWVLKPMKRGLLLDYFANNPVVLFGWQLSGAQAEEIAKVLNMVVAYGVVVGFTVLVRKLPRQRVILVFSLVFGALFLLFAARIHSPSEPLVWSLYVTGDIWTTVMVATFWAFSNDITTSEEAERMYGIVGLGGVVGGFVGASVVSTLVQDVGRTWLLGGLLVPLAVIVGLAYWIDARARERRGQQEERDEPCCPEEDEDCEDESKVAQEPGAGAAIEGAKLVLASKYLLGITAVIGLYELVSNIMNFQLGVIVEQQITGGPAKDAFFGRIGQITGLVSIGVQLFGTTYILRNLGVGAGLLFLPAVAMLGSVGFLVVPSLALASFMRVGDNALNYSVNQSAKEALYTPTSQDAKYKAKAFIDMFVQRFGKVVAVGLNLALSALTVIHVRWFSLASLLVIGSWILVVRYLGREFEARTGEGTDG